MKTKRFPFSFFSVFFTDIASSSSFLASTAFIAIVASVASVLLVLVVVAAVVMNRSTDDDSTLPTSMSEYGPISSLVAPGEASANYGNASLVVEKQPAAYGDTSFAALE